MKPLSFSVANIFNDHMVLQRDKPIKIWGESLKPQIITVYINERDIAGTFTAEGSWTVTLPAMEAGRNLKLKIAGEGENQFFTFMDVAIGEVWIAGGQSNMEFPLECDAEAQTVIPGVTNPDIRFYDCPKIKFDGQEKEDDFRDYGFWRPLNPLNAPYYSAVGFYFANKIAERYHVPVGIVGCNLGGTSASTWLDEQYLLDDEKLAIYCREYEENLARLDLDAYFLADKQAREFMNQPKGKEFYRYLLINRPDQLDYAVLADFMSSIRGYPQAIGPRSENRPGGLYHTMLRTIAGFAARGVIFYQGEADDAKGDLYARLFGAMIRCWREAWQDDLPFLFVQLPPCEEWLGGKPERFQIIREQQEIVSKTVSCAYMVSIMDSGCRNDVHPKHKRPVGERLALLARGKVYGEEILCEAPEASEVKRENGTLAIKFLHAGTGLTIKGDQLLSLEIFADGKELENLLISIDLDTLLVIADGIDSAKKLDVYYAYRNFAEVNLSNSAGLSAKPFRWSL